MLRLSQSRPVTTLDGISLYVYMTHNVFVVSSLSPYKYTENLLISTVLFFLLSFASAIVLKWSSEQIRRMTAGKHRT